jgi:phosphoglycolate phosphatase-like HAD superfamily hydrolase
MRRGIDAQICSPRQLSVCESLDALRVSPNCALAIQCGTYRSGLSSKVQGIWGSALCLRRSVGHVDSKDVIVTTDKQTRRLILFDLDGTLVNVATKHLQAFRVAMQTAYGLDVEGVLDRRSYQGETQPNVIRAACHVMGVSAEQTEALLPAALHIASQTTIALLERDPDGVALPGAVQLLEVLEESGQMLGLVTGTVSATARAILEWAGLQHFFPVRACGDEGRERADLVRLAIERATPVFGRQVHARELAVIGDAPRDIETGKAFGARTVAVATGNHAVDDLAACVPDAVLPNLADRNAALAAILGPADGLQISR